MLYNIYCKDDKQIKLLYKQVETESTINKLKVGTPGRNETGVSGLRKAVHEHPLAWRGQLKENKYIRW